MKKKYIVVLGILALLLIIAVGGITYYKERISLDEEQSYPEPFTLDKGYEIWLFNGEEWVDASDQEYFQAYSLVSINVNFQKLDIPYDPFVYCYYTDLNEEGVVCNERSGSAFLGINLGKLETPLDKEIFKLIKVSVFPDNNFHELDEFVLLDLDGKLLIK
ncbi:MAG: hypothetical protein PHG13_00505 [Candidatus Pacebacteria bacterium]|jgi:hypothetical protein|nr:hypothetical protein [Candidatus Paceibacterota bacterium]MDD5721598.1 hypothetical protein [Candidatus Paceibacterota bacterium]